MVANQPLCGHPDERLLLPDLKGLKRFVSMYAATFNLRRHLISRPMADWNGAAA
jgi:hypothetical protein